MKLNNSDKNEIQAIKLPNISKLQFEGPLDKSSKPKSLSIPGLQIRNLVPRKKTLTTANIKPSQQQQSLNSLNPNNQCFMNIRTIPIRKQPSSDDEDAIRQVKKITSVEKPKRKASFSKQSSPKSILDISVKPEKTKTSTTPNIGLRPPLKLKQPPNSQQLSKIINKLIAASFGLVGQNSLQSFKAFIDKGNNSMLVKQTLKTRSWWNIVGEEEEEPALVWTEFRQKSLTITAEEKVPVDTKLQLSKGNISMLEDCQCALKLLFPIEDKVQKITITDIIKLLKKVNDQTKFHLNIKKLQFSNHIPQNHNITNKKALFKNLSKWYSKNNLDPFEFIPVTFHVNGTQDQHFNQYLQYANSLPKKKSLWIIKPGQNTNRGNGITVHKGAPQVQAHLESIKTKHTYIVQSYIRPYLYNQRKFDIRCYALAVMINKKFKGYWFEEGYIRTASEPFSFKKTDKMIHLTNDAVQKYGQNYGKFQPGNKLSYQELSKYISSNSNRDFIQQVVPKMRSLCRDVFLSTQGKLGGDKSQDAFEVYGLDYMLDQDLKPWLIQVNTNPCLQLSSSLLSRVIPEMLQNAFKIALDPFLNTGKKTANNTSLWKNNRFELIFEN